MSFSTFFKKLKKIHIYYNYPYYNNITMRDTNIFEFLFILVGGIFVRSPFAGLILGAILATVGLIGFLIYWYTNYKSGRTSVRFIRINGNTAHKNIMTVHNYNEPNLQYTSKQIEFNKVIMDTRVIGSFCCINEVASIDSLIIYMEGHKDITDIMYNHTIQMDYNIIGNFANSIHIKCITVYVDYPIKTAIEMEGNPFHNIVKKMYVVCELYD